ncbi:3'-5' exonuclease [Streptomyces bugieae]|uniref:3'-5' exonuclease n=1 Tax=Streptomyces bugieae TaxID=3098223 RepID=UPI003AFF78B8
MEAWDATSCADVAAAIRRALSNESLVVSRQDPADVSLMSMHRSKGKEFDGVIIVEGTYTSKLLDAEWDAKRTDETRRLLRVSITRARHTVVFVRPAGASPSPHRSRPPTEPKRPWTARGSTASSSCEAHQWPSESTAQSRFPFRQPCGRASLLRRPCSYVRAAHPPAHPCRPSLTFPLTPSFRRR